MGLAIKDDGRFVRERADARSRLGRADLEAPVQLWSEGRGWSRGVLRNLSIGGLFVATRRSLPVGTRVLIRFSDEEGNEPDEIEAQVCWTRRAGRQGAASAGIGLQFTGPMVKSAIFVRVILRTCLPKPG